MLNHRYVAIGKKIIGAAMRPGQKKTGIPDSSGMPVYYDKMIICNNYSAFSVCIPESCASWINDLISDFGFLAITLLCGAVATSCSCSSSIPISDLKRSTIVLLAALPLLGANRTPIIAPAAKPPANAMIASVLFDDPDAKIALINFSFFIIVKFQNATAQIHNCLKFRKNIAHVIHNSVAHQCNKSFSPQSR